MKNLKTVHLLLLTSIIFLIAGCRSNGDTAVQPTTAAPASVETNNGGAAAETAVVSTPAPPPTVTPIPPTPTPTEPLAAIVNGEQILLADYEKQLARFQQSDPESSIDYQPIALNSMIDNVLITQTAVSAGHTVSEEQINQELNTLIESIQGRENFDAWLAANFYTEEELRQEIAFGYLSAPLLSEVAASVPTTGEQVRARYIKVADQALANTLLTQAQAGEDFAALANQNSLPEQNSPSPTGGDMGFFQPDWPLEGIPQTVKDAAFALQPGQTSQVISNAEPDGTTAYYLVQVVERELERPLPQQLLDQQRQEAILQWTQMLRENATIEIIVELGS